LTNLASAKHAVILRSVKGGNFVEDIPVNLKDLLNGKLETDIYMGKDDLLFVPRSGAKAVAIAAAQAAMAVGTGIAIYTSANN
jgi:hypothetical protein